MRRRRSGRSHSNLEPPLAPGGGRRGAGCRNSRRQESRGSRSEDAAQHGITVAAVAVAAHVAAPAAPAAVPAVAAAAGVGTAASALRGPRLLHYAPRGAPRDLPVRAARAPSRLSLALSRLSRYSGSSSTRRRTSLDSRSAAAGSAGQATAGHLDSLGARTGACPPLYIHTHTHLRARVPVLPSMHPRTHDDPSLSLPLVLSSSLPPSLPPRHRERAAPISSFFPRRNLRSAPLRRMCSCRGDRRARARAGEPPSRVFFFSHGAVRARITRRTDERYYPVDSSSPPIKRSRTTAAQQRTCLSRSTGRGRNELLRTPAGLPTPRRHTVSYLRFDSIRFDSRSSSTSRESNIRDVTSKFN